MEKLMEKNDIISEFGRDARDTGSSCVQIALLTQRIRHLTEHLKIHRKDFHSRRGLVAMTNRRRKLLSYLKLHKPEDYRGIIQKLNLRK
ncbi:MAG: 30S ribosomal protein S15 [Puniceicoccales bacterium]|jgi:small subunit ribosomal protein S15|nr:30S ribosomal protein S15 [Puniceicoccales bacterium]